MTKRKIDVYFNGKYVYSTNAQDTCKGAVAYAKSQEYIFVAGRSLKGLNLEVKTQGQKITAHFAKG